MELLQTLQIAFGALARTKTRSFLTVLGVIIGVAAVIAMVSIGEGAKARVAETFEGMGSNSLRLKSGSSQRGGARGGGGSQPTLTWDDMAAIESEVAGVAAVAPELRTGAQVISDHDNWQTSITGTTPSFFTIRDWPVAQGRLFTDAEVSAGAKVAVIGKTIADNLFPDRDPVGESIRISRMPFEVIGVAAEKGATPWGSDNDDRVVIPSSTYMQKIARGFNKYIPGELVIKVTSAAVTDAAKADIESLLRTRHHIRTDDGDDVGDNDDFHLRDPSEMAAAQSESASTITSLLAGVALVSLLVGGIGVMNIMLVSVTERTREIGLRMAVGAKQGHILSQFLVEAVVLAVAGGLAGVAAGIGAAQYMAAQYGFPLLIRADIVALAVVVSALVGIGFGLYPAHKASRLDPIQALRYE